VSRRRWIVVGLALALLVLAAAAAILLWYRNQPVGNDVRGSATVEFRPHDRPQVTPRPRDEVEAVPWPTYGYDNQRTHLAPFKVRPPFKQKWFFRTGYLLEFPPAVTRDLVVGVNDAGRVYAVDKATGELVWSRRYNRCAATSPTVAGKVVYIPLMQVKPCLRYPRTQRGVVVALRVSDGKELWRVTTSISESGLLYVDGILYYGAWDHAVYALDTRTRKIRWRTATDGEFNGAAAYAAKTIFIGNNAGSMYAFNAATGAVRWRARSSGGFLRTREYFYATPTVAYGRVYAGNTDGYVYAFGATTGNLLWERRAGTYVYTPPAVWDRRVFVGTYDGRFLALDAATGDTLWAYDAPSSIHGAPTVMDGLVYFATCGTCGHRGVRYAKRGPRRTLALDARTGRRVWSFADGQYSPVVADSTRLYLVGQGWVYGMEPTGQR
jgi:outer membrane protein assembly factor BamB